MSSTQQQQKKGSYKDKFTPEQKEAYKQQKETEKQEYHELYKKFVEKKSIQDFIGIIANYKQVHSYSFGNIFYVMAQADLRRDKKFVGIMNSYQNWKKQDVQVLKGSKAYKVRVPIFSKVKKLTMEGGKEKEREEKMISFFKHGNTFDVSQTSEYENYLKEQEKIDEVIMKNAEIDYNVALDFVKSNFPEVSITEDFKHQEKKGSYVPQFKHITLHERSSHTVFHEIGHHITIEVLKIAKHPKEHYAFNEVLAEMTAYFLMKSFDESIKYNFAYSNVWSGRIEENFEVDEFITLTSKILEYISKYF
ncbi:MAG: ArdC-like ssDNA-binding domain-containing protein [Promethearchaeota archaeon]